MFHQNKRKADTNVSGFADQFRNGLFNFFAGTFCQNLKTLR